MFCMPELARILKQQSYPNGAPCLKLMNFGERVKHPKRDVVVFESSLQLHLGLFTTKIHCSLIGVKIQPWQYITMLLQPCLKLYRQSLIVGSKTSGSSSCKSYYRCNEEGLPTINVVVLCLSSHQNGQTQWKQQQQQYSSAAAMLRFAKLHCLASRSQTAWLREARQCGIAKPRGPASRSQAVWLHDSSKPHCLASRSCTVWLREAKQCGFMILTLAK